MENQNQWISAEHESLKMCKATRSLRNPKVKSSINKSQRKKGQIMDSNNKRHLSNLCNKNSGSKIELV